MDNGLSTDFRSYLEKYFSRQGAFRKLLLSFFTSVKLLGHSLSSNGKNSPHSSLGMQTDPPWNGPQSQTSGNHLFLPPVSMYGAYRFFPSRPSAILLAKYVISFPLYFVVHRVKTIFLYVNSLKCCDVEAGEMSQW